MHGGAAAVEKSAVEARSPPCKRAAGLFHEMSPLREPDEPKLRYRQRRNWSGEQFNRYLRFLV